MKPFDKMFTSKEIIRGTRRSLVYYLCCAAAVLGFILVLQISWGIGNYQGLTKYYSEGIDKGIEYGIRLCESRQRR